ncbi:MAG: helix-turn-helix transcriptional regulator [Clostridiaceae bacterium]|nr:helix-turn-helix transcriptional regulator [Clostridiaceae bacterium]
MANSAENLKSVMDYFGITNNELARALSVDPSLVSRWLNGQRRLKASNPAMDALAEYILARSKRVHDIEWLKTQFEEEGLPTDISTVYRLKQNLIMWLASDGEALRRNLGSLPSASVIKEDSPKKTRIPYIQASGSPVKIGYLDIALELEPLLSELPEESTLDIFLSSDEIATAVSEDISRLLLHMTERSRLRIRLLVCVSGNTTTMSRLIGTYMQPLVSGHIRLSVVHGMTQNVTNQMYLVIPESCTVLIVETPKTSAPPVAAIVYDKRFVSEMQKSFEEALRYSQPVLNIYSDDFSRNILEIIYTEFAAPGDLDVVKDSINPMYMTPKAYDGFLRVQGHRNEEFEWRSAEFIRFKSGMDETLKGGSVFREILSLARLNQIAQDGFCHMPGLYFMNKGFVNLDAEGCTAILDGYIHYLNTMSNFHLLILDDISSLHADNCWQLKRNHHVAINHWRGDEPVMIHSDQLMLIREFQVHFESLWARGNGCIGNRSSVIAALQDIVERLKRRHSIKNKEAKT